MADQRIMNSVHKLFQPRALLFWILAGLCLRLALMPFTGHDDLYSTYTKSAYLAFDGRMFPSKFALLWLFFHSAILKFYSFFWPEVRTFFSLSDQVTMAPDTMAILSSSQIFRLTFLLKLPYLLLEALTLWLFTKMFSSLSEKTIAVIAWVCNPFMIHALYIHGRNEILVVFFMVLFLLTIQRKQWHNASLFLGLSVAVRMFSLAFLPFYLLALYKEKISPMVSLRQAGLVLLPVLVSVGLSFWLGDHSIPSTQQAPLTFSFFTPATLSVGHGMEIYLLPALLLTIIFLAWWYEAVRSEAMLKWLYIVLLVSLSIAFYHPHYFAWLTPFMTWSFVVMKKERAKLVLLYSMQLMAWGMTVLFWGMSVTIGLFSPIDPFIFKSLGSPLELIRRVLLLFEPVSMGRAIILAVHGMLSFVIWHQHINPELDRQEFVRHSLNGRLSKQKVHKI